MNQILTAIRDEFTDEDSATELLGADGYTHGTQNFHG
jgi:hypothetical protein